MKLKAKTLLQSFKKALNIPSFLKSRLNFRKSFRLKNNMDLRENANLKFDKQFTATSSLSKTLHPVWVSVKKQKTLWILLFLALLVSDLLVMKSYEYIMPKSKLSPLKISMANFTTQKDYQILWKKNIFHTGSIPSQLFEPTNRASGLPVPTSLPFKLKGTIVHRNPHRSVVTIEDQTNKSLSYKLGEMIGGQAQITKIERGKVIFLNQNNNRTEYIALPKDEKIQISYDRPGLNKATDLISTNSIVSRKGNQFQIDRSNINTHLGRLHEVLQQARVIPHRVNRDGVSVIEGYVFAKIDKGSIYEDLGFQEGDIIKSVNGEAVQNPQKALEMFEKFKTSSGLKVLVERDGKAVEFEYGVNEDTPIN